MEKFKVTTLGNCGNQTAENEGVAFIVDTDSSFLIDAGPGIVRQILRANRKFSGIENIIITHPHGDHISGFPYLIWNYFYESLGGIKCPEIINIYCFNHLKTGLINMFELCYGPLDKFPFHLNFIDVPLDDKGYFKIKETIFETLPVDHTSPNFAVKLFFDNRNFVYSSDTLYFEPLADFSKNADLLIHEAFVPHEMFDLSRRTKHSTATDAGTIANKANVKSLGLVHYFPPFTNKKEVLVEEAKQFFTGKTFIPEELSVIDL